MVTGSGKQNRNKRYLYWLIMVVCILAAVAALVYLVRYYKIRQDADQLYSELRGQETFAVEESQEPETEPAFSEASEAGTETTEEVPEVRLEGDMARVIDFDVLKEETNKDIYAWIYIPDTHIDYPMVQHPTDNLYYLKYNLDGTKGYPGCIYTEKENAKDFSDFNTLIYGHNMKNGTMFHDLHKYADEEFLEEHPYVYIYMEGRVLQYQIFAAYKYDDRHLLYAFDYSSAEKRNQYLADVLQQRNMNAVFDRDVVVNSDSHIITMSTCVGGQADKRFLVQAVLIQDINIS